MKFLIAVIFSFFASNLFASEWKFAGFSKGGDETDVIFFDSASISRSDFNIKFWIASFNLKEIGAIAKINQDHINKIFFEEKKLDEYAPNISLINSIKGAKLAEENSRVQMLYILSQATYVVSNYEINPTGKIYFEINCATREYRSIEGEINNPPTRTTKPSKFSNIYPDSNTESWFNFFCK